MGTLSLWHWIIVVLFFVTFGVPIARILRRAGRSRWWTVMFFVPLVNLVALWVFAFTRWPAVDGRSN